eukprot:TRINITY_DN9071_c0_g2_i1.p1 TRINITY_DN9071_c0_g2~~TRINITY_DN9071_c0_g2_i1.p1  ORF type:complete len:341 (+),score=56.11 TRINITY_DN9071_c0_g2_i1:62-1084(+)
MSLDFRQRQIFSEKKGVLYASFNQDHGCFSVGTDEGFRVYNCDPFRLTVSRDNGGIGIAEMLYRTNIFALVGGGSNPAWQPNRVQLWDDHTAQVIGTLDFKDAEVKAVKMHNERIVVATSSFVHVYDRSTLELHQKYRTVDNPLGIMDVSALLPCVVTCPAWKTGVARVESADERTGFVRAHESGVAILRLSADGTLLATASGKGTLIRVFDTATQKQVKEVRRGSERTAICSLSFSVDNMFLAASSEHGSVHVFSLAATEEAAAGAATQNTKSLFAGLGSWFDSEWSFTQYRAPDGPCVCAFGADSSTLYVLTGEGSCLKLRLAAGETTQCVSSNRFTR